MLLERFANFESQIQSRKIGIRILEQLDHPQALPIMLESAVLSHALGQHFFTGMSKRRVSEIVRERDRFRQIFIQGQRPRDRSANRSDFNRMGQPRPQVITGAV